MISKFLSGVIITLGLVLFDKNLSDKIKGKYYLSHTIINSFITFYTFNDMISCYTDFNNSINNDINLMPSIMVYSLHFYHMIAYYKKLRFDDWLHHILMVIVALPLANIVDAGSLLNHSLFFLCGLPGGIDYLMLFLVRNNIIDRMTEKYWNKVINLWIRAPGCISHMVLSLISFFNYRDTIFKDDFNKVALFVTAILVFWNGIYFMEQVVSDYKKNEMIKCNKKIDK